MIAEERKCLKGPGKCSHSNQEWDEATGGIWIFGIPIWFGYMLKLAEHNYDHFSPRAKTAYLVGHKYAIQTAREAGNYCFGG